MRKECPECKDYLVNNKCRTCGFALDGSRQRDHDPDRHLCAFINHNGNRCQMPGTIAKDIARPDENTRYYCTWHGFYNPDRHSLDKFTQINPFKVSSKNLFKAWDAVNGESSLIRYEGCKYSFTSINKKPEYKSVVPEEKKDEYYMKSKEMFSRTVNRDLVGFDLANEMYAMDKEFPGLGWKEYAGVVLSNHYKEKGMTSEEIKSLLPD